MVKQVSAVRSRESVWDYPRPPALEAVVDLLLVEFDGRVIAETRNAYRVLETSHPPTYYFPPTDVDETILIPSARQTFCEFKGYARYWSLRSGDRFAEDAAWFYPTPTDPFAAIKDYIAFYPSRVDACFIAGERVIAQDGDFYGGWITRNIVGPFKGGTGTAGW